MSSSSQKQKLVAILGPTAVGKSEIGVWLAKTLGGIEIISADSRQVYRGLDIGSGKITAREMRSVPHHLLDVASVKRSFSVAEYKKHAERKIREIAERGNTPVLVGGSPFYISAVADGIMLPEVPPNPSLRKRLQSKSAEELFNMLKEKDPRRATEIDKDNKRRLLRALEIVHALGKVPRRRASAPYHVLKIGLDTSDKVLKEHIRGRLQRRMRRGMVAEVRQLHNAGVSWRRLEALGLEYRYCAQYLQDKIEKEELAPLLSSATWDFVRRQRAWWRQDKTIIWFRPSEKQKILRHVENFLQ